MFALNIRSPNYPTVIGFGPTRHGVVKIMLVDVTSVRDEVYLYIDEDLLGNLAEGELLQPNSLLTIC